MKDATSLSSLLLLLLLIFSAFTHQTNSNPTVCIIGSGSAGSSVAHFLRRYSSTPKNILMFERNSIVGGRMETMNVFGETVEVGGSILMGSNLHAVEYTKYLDLKRVKLSLEGFGTWDGKRVVVGTDESKGVMGGPSVTSFLEEGAGRFSKLYDEERPAFESVDEMLKWAGLSDYTSTTLEDLLTRANLSPLFIQSTASAMSRFSFLEDASSISGLAGVVSLFGMIDYFWAVEGGNWQMASGLINRSDVELHLEEEITSISRLGDYYELNSTKGDSYKCEVAVIATPLDELHMQFRPSISIRERRMQHLEVTIIRGLINPAYFGLKEPSDFPAILSTSKENPDVPFIAIYIVSKHSKIDLTYKIFSREPVADALLDHIFRERKATARKGWSAMPYFNAPEVFAPYILDGQHLYYVNTFENAVSAIEMSAISADNVARLVVSRFFSTLTSSEKRSSSSSDTEGSFLEEL